MATIVITRESISDFGVKMQMTFAVYVKMTFEGLGMASYVIAVTNIFK